MSLNNVQIDEITIKYLLVLIILCTCSIGQAEINSHIEEDTEDPRKRLMYLSKKDTKKN